MSKLTEVERQRKKKICLIAIIGFVLAVAVTASVYIALNTTSTGEVSNNSASRNIQPKNPNATALPTPPPTLKKTPIPTTSKTSTPTNPPKPTIETPTPTKITPTPSKKTPTPTTRTPTPTKRTPTPTKRTPTPTKRTPTPTKRTPTPTKRTPTPAKRTPTPRAGGKTARLTHYTSYPDCCDNPNAGDKSECSHFNGCRWKGQFYCTSPKDLNWVKNNNIVAFYDDSDPHGNNFRGKYCNRKIRLTKKMRNGSTVSFVATIYDTCGNNDCNGCCKKNSLNGVLVDVEKNTAKRNFGSLAEAGWGTIEYEIL